jgi:F420-dependent oxidoreductase-like protein
VKLGIYLGYASPGTNPTELIDRAVEAEALGYDSAWAAEAWGTDVVSVLSWLGARTTTLKLGAGIMQIPARSAGMTAMTAATLDLMSGGRFLLGLGLSGPQVAEGWHGQPWGPPLERTREYVELVRRMIRREAVDFHGQVYDVPLTGDGTTGLGIPLKMMMRPLRPDIPVYLAAIGPRNVALAAEIADGWLPIFVSPERFRDVFPLDGLPEHFDIAAGVNVVLTKDRDGGRQFVKHHLALYVGGMGARGKNFYNDLVRRYGYEKEAVHIQDLYLDGKRLDAADAVPDALVDEVALVGSRDEIADRLAAWRECGVTTLIVQSHDPETLQLMAELCL